MLILTFCIGPTHFAIDARRVSQVVPRVPLRALPLTERYVAGLLDFRGHVLVVVDLAARLFGTACASRLSTRIIIVRLHHDNREMLLGLIAEQVTELCQADVAAAIPSTTLGSEDDCLGRMLRVGDTLAQWINVDQVLPATVRTQIFEHMLD